MYFYFYIYRMTWWTHTHQFWIYIKKISCQRTAIDSNRLYTLSLQSSTVHIWNTWNIWNGAFNKYTQTCFHGFNFWCLNWIHRANKLLLAVMRLCRNNATNFLKLENLTSSTSAIKSTLKINISNCFKIVNKRKENLRNSKLIFVTAISNELPFFPINSRWETNPDRSLSCCRYLRE